MFWRRFKVVVGLLVALAASCAALYSFLIAAIGFAGLVDGGHHIRIGIQSTAVGLVFVAIVFANAVWLRRLKMPAGCCEHCGYDLRGSANSARCPECGHQTTRKSARDTR